MKIYYFDTNKMHCDWWKELSSEVIPIDEDGIRRNFTIQLTMPTLEIRLSEQPSEKFLFIIHTSESYFKPANKVTNLFNWKDAWSKYYANYSTRICIIFVSGGTLQVDNNDIYGLNSHYLYPYPLIDKKKIVDEFKYMIENWERTDSIAFLRRELSYLSALFILCQGFLVAHATDNNDKELVNKALCLMGWDKIDINKQAQLQSAAQSNINVTETYKWWSDALGGANKNDYSERLLAEYGNELPDEIKSLVTAIENESSIKSKQVADAYLILHSKLTG